MNRLEDRSFADFAAACQNQQVEIHDELYRAAATDVSDIFSARSYLPSGLQAAISQAGKLTRQAPGEPLADGYLDASYDFRTDTSSRSLIDLLNATLERQPDLPRQLAINFDGPAPEELDTCHLADYCFMVTASGLGRMTKKAKVLQGCQIFTHFGTPAMLRKSSGVESAMSLREVSLNGIPYPAGSIFSLDFRSQGDVYNPDAPAERVEVLASRRIDAASFLRLSAFALDPAERLDAGFRASTACRKGETELFYRATIQDFRFAAEDALVKLEENSDMARSFGAIALANS